MPGNDKWEEWRNHVLAELKRLASAQERMQAELFAQRARSAGLGAVTGLLGSLVCLLIKSMLTGH